MSSKKAIREVQLDIERTVKKVIEGVDIFEQIFEKIQTTTNPAQKDKLQGDLKREIKKLQRQRDEIKVWIGMNEIKDKSVLLEYRKIIEQEMEKFKACEKELKTKAFSKEGLQKQVVMDPEEQERDNMRTWITDAVDKLNTNMEILDAELETLSAKKKGKIDKAKEPRLIHVKFRIDRHKFHVNRLELVLRLLDNCSLEVAAVSSIQDSVDYYVSNFDDPDFDDDVANEYYVDLNLDEVAGFGTPHDDLGGDNDEDEESHEEEPEPPQVDPPRKSNIDSPKLVKSEAVKPEAVKVKLEKVVAQERKGSIVKIAAVKPVAPSPNRAQTPVSSPIVVPPKPEVVPAAVTHLPVKYAAAAAAPVEPKVGVIGSRPPLKAETEFSTPDRKPSDPTLSSINPVNNLISPSADDRLPACVSDLVASYDITRERAARSREDATYILQMLETSSQYIPDVSDFERSKHYIAQKPYPSPTYYPQQPLPIFENPLVYEKFDIDTLFFIFYYQQGTFQQYLASRELKRQSWRFHKLHLTWFQRHEEPKSITDLYEQGTYIYFDYEGSWCQRKKADFRFEYRYLEDGETS